MRRVPGLRVDMARFAEPDEAILACSNRCDIDWAEVSDKGEEDANDPTGDA